MLSRLLSAALTGLALLALTPAFASAQIYVWRDQAGNLVLSDRPKDPSARTYAIATTGNVRVTRPAISRRSALYDDLIEQHSAEQGVRPELVRAVIQAESAFNPNARSVKGAMGLMQLMPATAVEYGVANPYEPRDNIRAGVTYLRSLLTRYDDREELALAAYNAGPGAVQKYGGTVPPYRETRNYVDRIRSATMSGPAAPAPFRLYRVVQIVEGREVVKYSNVAAPGAQLMSSASRR
jgi:soluble lytic murein transglycosylase-like protein